MMRDSHHFAPTRCNKRLLGDFEDGIADKEEPSAEGVRGRTDAEVGLELCWANETLLGPGTAITYISSRNAATSRSRTFRFACFSSTRESETCLGFDARRCRPSVSLSAVCVVGCPNAVVATTQRSQCMCLPPSTAG